MLPLGRSLLLISSSNSRRLTVLQMRFQGSSDPKKPGRQKEEQENFDGENISLKQSEGSTEVDDETVEMWNHDAPNGPEWGGPRGYEPTKFGDWSKNCRVTDF
ncbi:hypothetical protein Gasu2_45130 [Galdieria sulphuraria]|uniref:Succinate dehydrogenase assembly factor 4, mitochondrial n=1 Tax=Galdieria sulphuraria TaxID=130081 RepID=M2W7L1_GALSU|nr:uncharacterized protein Gasu_08890 [Galdieria sulphuraria]EME31811.1 hypothetical protein Gasu_08890 [Galdieria sulphuraria]GJD10316.1 hypothetical protein Gasu2_45130 [Galdieria sulphuraria]|eukprot:XP_005708331.1 hypothetical protein Gasu_08890 [Galdieria sulphuraria]